MLRSYLNRRRFCKCKGDEGVVERFMDKLSARVIRLESTELMICPPILIASKSSKKDGRACRERYDAFGGNKGHTTAGRFLLCAVLDGQINGVGERLMLDCLQSEVQMRLQRRVRMGNQR